MLKRFSKRVAGTVAIAAIGLGTPGCLTPTTANSSSPRETVSRKLNPFVYFEEGGAMFIGVDTRAAQLTQKGSVFPLGIGIVNHASGTIRLGRESFTLELPDGTRLPVISIEEFNAEYNRGSSDRRLADQFSEIMRVRYGSNYVFQPWNPFATGSRGTAADNLELARAGWTQTHLYFPVPDTGLKGRDFQLIVTPYGSPESYLVRFSVR